MVKLIFLVNLIGLAYGWYYGRPAPDLMTRGGVWPLPQAVTTYNNFTHNIDPASFQFTINLSNCDIIDKAFQRYMTWMFPFKQRYMTWMFPFKQGFPTGTNKSSITLTQLNVIVNKCDNGYPQMEMNEQYTLVMDPSSPTATLIAEEVWGALRGLESFSHLVFKGANNNWFVKTATIIDKPRFQHRGTMLDSSRHFISISLIKRNLELMAMNKMNVFHWHLTDSESFPYQSLKFPEMSAQGAFTPMHVYNQSQIKDVIDYARLLGIRVVAEFDTPGHMGAWGLGRPGLLASCYSDGNDLGYGPDGKTILSNIIDPTKQENLQFIKDFFDEALHLFPDNYMHFGGDETIDYQNSCWLNNSDISAWMKNNSMANNNTQLLNYYLTNLVKSVQNVSSTAKMIFWQEVLDQNVAPNSSIAHVWKGGNYNASMEEMFNVTRDGHLAIYSSCWYLNYIKYGAVWGYDNSTNFFRDRGMYYECDPTGFNGTDQQKSLVLGGEVCMWGEMVDGTNLIPRLWPNAGAAAERLWSDPAQTKSANAAWPRFHEHRCRLLARGYQVEPPNDPDFCYDEYDPVFQAPTPPAMATTAVPTGAQTPPATTVSAGAQTSPSMNVSTGTKTMTTTTVPTGGSGKIEFAGIVLLVSIILLLL
uniref:Beta-hexosaminidase n=1 Tax=Acrobeloides nanus TaxID=290746 RepID=A0A914EKU3_9BILA